MIFLEVNPAKKPESWQPVSASVVCRVMCDIRSRVCAQQWFEAARLCFDVAVGLREVGTLAHGDCAGEGQPPLPSARACVSG